MDNVTRRTINDAELDLLVISTEMTSEDVAVS